MYAEKHYFQSRTMQRLQWVSAALAFWQLTALLGAETGLRWLPLGYPAHLLLLILAVTVLLSLRNLGLSLRVSPKGWALRLTPAQWHDRHIAWAEIKKLRLLALEELPQKPNKGFGQSFLISNPAYKVLCIELTNGFQVFVSIQKPQEMMTFLHTQVFQSDLKRKVLV